MGRLVGAGRSYNRLDESSSSSRSARPSNTLDRQSLSLKAILRPQSISLERRRASTGAIGEERQNVDLEAGYPSIIDTNVILPVTGAMEDASSVSYEGFHCVAFPSFSDGTETDGSFRTAPMMPAVKSTSIGSGNISSFSDQEFLSCREGSDQFSTSSIFADARSCASAQFSHQDSDGDSFYTCRRFNDQGLRSVLAVPTNVKTDLAFNIPLHVFAATIEEAALRKQAADFRNQFIWRPVKVMSLLAILAAAIALAIVLTRDRHTAEVPTGSDGMVTPPPALIDSVPSSIPSMAPPSSSWPPTIVFPTLATEIDGLTPSVAPRTDGNLFTAGPTSFVFAAGNFEEIHDIPPQEGGGERM
jgi:hypothetical protein